jgi:PKD repeat protein
MLRILLILTFIFCSNLAIAQKSKCLSEVLHNEAMANDSTYRHNRLRIQKAISAYARLNSGAAKSNSQQVRIIPVVFHVIHEGGPENISLAQIQDQIRILNRDYQKQNKDTINTPNGFKHYAADCNIEFRLAQKDPFGNCTQGVVRINSPLTNNARDNVKTLSIWPTDKYLNIWTVKSILNAGTGSVLGYAQFPGGKSATDGVVLRSDVIGSIETGATSYFGKNEAGRTATHEVGHWLDLFHVWGDQNNCQGNDHVDDTPPQNTSSTGCPVFPVFDACSPSGDGIMFMNYMDYTDGVCLNMFTSGQKLRMDATLNSIRATITSDQNLAFTNVNDTSAKLCPPIPSFFVSNSMVCPQSYIAFKDISYNGVPDKWEWSFPGGTPSFSSDPNPVVYYAMPGRYDVSLTVSNQAGSNTSIVDHLINVSNPIATYTAPFADDFEAENFPGTDWSIYNEDNGATWQRTASLTTNKDGWIGIPNFKSNIPLLKDILLSPSIDVSPLIAPHLFFKVAYAKASTQSTDQLTVYISNTCGRSWSIVNTYPKAGDLLATAGIMSDTFIPNPLQWRTEKIDLSNKLITGMKTNIRFKFEFQNGGGNNIYLDDFHVDNNYSKETPKEESLNLSFFPNPSGKDVYMGFNLYEQAKVTLSILDPIGKEYQVFEGQSFDPGEHSFHIDTLKDPGFYFVKMVVGTKIYINKLVIQY